jgi:hypothetical protein
MTLYFLTRIPSRTHNRTHTDTPSHTYLDPHEDHSTETNTAYHRTRDETQMLIHHDLSSLRRSACSLFLNVKLVLPSFPGRPMILFPFGPHFSACLGILSVSVLSVCAVTTLISTVLYCFQNNVPHSNFLPDGLICSLSNLVIPKTFVENFFVLFPFYVNLSSSAPRLHYKTSRPLYL